MFCCTMHRARPALQGRIHVAGLLMALILIWGGSCASTRVEPLTNLADPPVLHPTEQSLWEIADRLEGQIATYVKPATGHEQAEQYLIEILRKLTPDFSESRPAIRIRILPDPSPNAFVMPNGAMYVNSGLLALLENEAQIATVLAHELAHFRYRHSYREKVKENNEMIKGAIFGGALAVLANTKETGNSAADLWRISSVSGYSRQLENEADHVGLLAVLQAGYEPEQTVRAFERLQTVQEDDDAEDARFATHPRLRERIASYRKRLQQPDIQRQATGRLVAEDVYEDKLFEVILANARLNLDEENYALARENLRRCLRVNPKSGRAHFLSGELERNGPMGSSFSALDCYSRALRWDPNCVEAHREIGLLQRELGDRDKARESLRAYMERAGNAADAPLIRSYLEQIGDDNAPLPTPYRPLRITPQSLRDKGWTVGIVPMFIPDDVVEPGKRKDEFERALVERLQQAGFTAAPSSAYETIYESLKKTMGALYDPNTGKPLEDRHDLVAKYAFREYIRAHRIDVLVFPALVTVPAKWRTNRAEWHGVREATTGKEGFWADRAAPSAYGTIPALSFRMHISNVYGDLCYYGFGGIQLCSRIVRGDFVDVPMHEMLTDSAKNVRSVDIACQALLKESK